MKNKMRFLTTKQARRRGIAMEMAISILMVTFALSSLIVSIAMVEIDKMDRSTETLLQRTQLEQLGQDFCAIVADGDNLTDWAARVEQYRAEVTGAGSSTVTLRVSSAEDPQDEPATVLLQVVLEKQAGSAVYTVTQWAYRE